MKANQPSLLKIACTTASNNDPADTAFLRKKGQSRQEDRTVETFPVGDALVGTERQPFIKTIIRVTRRTLLHFAETALWSYRGEVAFYVSPASGYPATAWAAAIRDHWGIENRNHHVRDVSCDENKSRIRINAGITARTRSFALNIMRKSGVTNITQTLWNGALRLAYIMEYEAI
ncbi:hypothetical protein [Insolitispirillum peregrinum]|uniref:Transposase DDE domain-containing protein n=1 Tax=Insolitispirillum peregrinum TaxID=80876 RepID=A0A1N7MTJ6_9PROT|nr:hypothetical protein [Insolitispirillum peregrinum]SIS89453.1 hypothetical protein SAMN05421779_104346 [Insolitispirillum peregrinum]